MNAPTPLANDAASLPPDETTELMEWTALHALTDKLHLIEQRLGTPDETPDDECHARELGHEIRNRLNVLKLREEFRELMLAKAANLQQTA